MPTKEERSTSQSDGSGFRHSTPLATISAPAALEREDLSVVAASASSAHQNISETTLASDFGSASLNVMARMDGVELLDRSSQLPRPSAPSRPALVPAETVPINIPSAHPPTSISPIRNTLSMTEKMDDLADAFLSGPSRRADQGLEPVIQPEPLPTDISELEKLRLLVTRRAWETVVVVGMQLLRDSKRIQHAPIYSALLNNPAQALPSLESQQAEVVEIMSLCCHGWWKSRQREALCQELDRWSFGHHVGGHAPSWIPWSLHIWGAISLQFVSEDGSDGDPEQIAIDALWAIRTKIRLNAEKDASLGSQSASLLQVEHVLSNIFVQLQEWRMAVACLERMMEALDGLVANEVETLVEKGQRSVAALVLKYAYQSEILSRQGRILLQAGAVSEAAQIFQQASDVWNALDDTAKEGVLSKHVATRHVPCQLLSNEGLVCFAYGKYDEALEFFRQATERMRANQCTVPEYSRDDWVGFVLVSNETYEGLYSQVLNNLALCALYTSRLQKAIQVMESLIREDPTRYLTERVAMNLCTLYELGADTAVAARQKRTLQIIAKRFLLQDIGPECFRSNTSG